MVGRDMWVVSDVASDKNYGVKVKWGEADIHIMETMDSSKIIKFGQKFECQNWIVRYSFRIVEVEIE